MDIAEVIDKLKAAVSLLEAHGQEAASTAGDLIQQAAEILASAV